MGKDGQKVHGRAPGSVLPDIDNEQPTVASDASGGGGSRTSPPIPPATYAAASGVGSDAATEAPSSASTQSTGSPKTFEFVLVTDSESRKQVRRHAMRQYMRQRRLDGIARLESSRVPVSGWAKEGAYPPGADSFSAGKVEEIEEDNVGDRNNVSSTRTIDSRKRDSISRKNETIIKKEATPVLAPRALSRSSGFQDPFESYPMAANATDRVLIHHFVHTYPHMMYKISGGNQSNPVREIFRQFALHDPVSFQAMLAIASKHRAGVKGQTESVQSITHKMRALRLMNERLQTDPNGNMNGTIYAAATLAVIEKWSKDSNIERMHVKGLAMMARRRGGMRGIKASSPFLEAVLYWVDFSCAPKAIPTASLPWTGNVPDTLPSTLEFLSPDPKFAIPYPPTDPETAEDTMDILRACEDFLVFFRFLNSLQQSLIRTPTSLNPSLNQDQGMSSARVNYLGPSSALYNILMTLPDYDHGIRDVRFIDEYSCLACLLYMNVALYDCYSKGRNFDLYLAWLAGEIKRLNPFEYPSISSVLWLFMNDGGFTSSDARDEGERSWVVSRMLRVAKRLEWKRGGKLWDYLSRVLVGFLITQQECGLGCDDVGGAELLARQQRLSHVEDQLWDEDEIRREILGELYAGPPIYVSSPHLDFATYAYAQPQTLRGANLSPTF